MTPPTAILDPHVAVPNLESPLTKITSHSDPHISHEGFTESSGKSGAVSPNRQDESADRGLLIECPVTDLLPHPGIELHHLSIDARRLSRIATIGSSSFLNPIIINQEFQILCGYELVHYARLKHQESLPCLQYPWSQNEYLLWLLRYHARSAGLNDFCRILLALKLEPALRAEALKNQSRGGKWKGSSGLAQAVPVDVRAHIAKAASVSSGNVSKVKKLLTLANPVILEGLRCGELTINQASQWSTFSHYEQQGAYKRFQSDLGTKTLIRKLVAKLDSSNNLTVVELVTSCYVNFSADLGAEVLLEKDGVQLWRGPLRKWMIEDGLWLSRRQRRNFHEPRLRRESHGALVQIDGSDHRWFEQRGPACSLLAFINDATGQLMQLRFLPSESTSSYFESLRAIRMRTGARWLSTRISTPCSGSTARPRVVLG